ncbi:MAG TPA: hypothetical protein ENK08_07405, partial [Chloroflexi bacterium]|nr:hypothetical protein [Chloroflexota bacterium]
VPPTPEGATPTPIPPPVPKPNTGVQVDILASDPDQTLWWAEELGVGWVKQQLDWASVEKGPGEFDWVQLDYVIDRCKRHHFRVLLSVVDAPTYLRADPSVVGPPVNYAEFRRFMQQLAERYRGKVEAYELWNEPNLAREWGGDVLDPARFAALVAEGAQGVRAGDPDALVISGAPGVTGINDGVTAIDDRVFLRGMLEAGVAQWVDGIGAHPYGFANPPEESVNDPHHVAPSHNDHPSFFFRDTLEDYRALLLEYGADDKPIWVTEFGWASMEGLNMDTTGWEYALHVSEQQQADYLVRALQMGWNTPWVGPMFIWNLNIAVIYGNSRPESAYSLLRPDGSWRPAFIAVRLAGPP